MSTSDHEPDPRSDPEPDSRSEPPPDSPSEPRPGGERPHPRPTSPHGPRPDAPALAVEAYVVEDQGRWAVEIVVVFPDEAVRRRVNAYPSRRQAEIAASWVKRAAQRDIEGPIHG